MCTGSQIKKSTKRFISTPSLNMNSSAATTPVNSTFNRASVPQNGKFGGIITAASSVAAANAAATASNGVNANTNVIASTNANNVVQANSSTKPPQRQFASPWQYELHELIPKYKSLKTREQRRELIGKFNFTTDSEQIIQKYSMYPPSIEFNIYQNHYRFGSQEGVIAKNDPAAKDFLVHVAREEIPPEMVDVLYDGGIRVFEGCVIVKINDHRHAPGVLKKDEETSKATKGEKPPQSPSKSASAEKIEPKSYKAVLKPTSLSMYHDLLYISDRLSSSRSNDFLLEIESRYLPILKPKLELSVPLNPFKCNSYIQAGYLQEAEAQHSEEITVKRVDLHENNIAAKGSEYEEFMLLLSQNDNKTNNSNKFSRLRFLEYSRKKLSVSNSSQISSKPQNNRLSPLMGNQVQQMPIKQQQTVQQQSSIQSPAVQSPQMAQMSQQSPPFNNFNQMSPQITPQMIAYQQHKLPKKPGSAGINKGQNSATTSTVPISGQISGQSSATNSPNMGKAQPRKRQYNTKKKKEELRQQQLQQQAQAQAQIQSQAQSQSQPQISSQSQSMNASVAGSPNIGAAVSPALSHSRISTPGASEINFNTFSPKLSNFNPQNSPGVMSGVDNMHSVNSGNTAAVKNVGNANNGGNMANLSNLTNMNLNMNNMNMANMSNRLNMPQNMNIPQAMPQNMNMPQGLPQNMNMSQNMNMNLMNTQHLLSRLNGANLDKMDDKEKAHRAALINKMRSMQNASQFAQDGNNMDSSSNMNMNNMNMNNMNNMNMNMSNFNMMQMLKNNGAGVNASGGSSTGSVNGKSGGNGNESNDKNKASENKNMLNSAMLMNNFNVAQFAQNLRNGTLTQQEIQQFKAIQTMRAVAAKNNSMNMNNMNVANMNMGNMNMGNMNMGNMNMGNMNMGNMNMGNMNNGGNGNGSNGMNFDI